MLVYLVIKLNRWTGLNMFSVEKGRNNMQLIQHINNLGKLTNTAIRKTMYDCGKDLAADARNLINLKPKHGALYRLKHGMKGKELKRIRKYQASAPGEAPGVITGKLRKSINFTVTGVNQLEFGADARKGGATYGKYLEYGNLLAFSGQGSKHIKPRPFISASYKKNKVKMMQRFDKAIQEAIK
jgi:HK97 gp10 family phage protein